MAPPLARVRTLAVVAGLAADAGNSAAPSNIIVIVSFLLNFDMGYSFDFI